MIQSINATITPDQLKKLRNIAKIAKKSCPTREFFKYMKFEKVLEMDSDGAFVEQLEISATDSYIIASIRVKAEFKNFDEPVYFHCGSFKPRELKVGDPDCVPDLARHLITPPANFRFAISAKTLRQAMECVQSMDENQSIIIEGNTQDKRAIRISHKAKQATALVCLLNEAKL